MTDFYEWTDMLYSNLGFEEYNDDKTFIIFSCVSMYKNTYAFGLNLPDKNKCFYISMISPEILTSYKNQNIDKEDIDRLVNKLNTTDIWKTIISYMYKCIKNESFTKDDASIEFEKIPSTPPDYRKILEDIS